MGNKMTDKICALATAAMLTASVWTYNAHAGDELTYSVTLQGTNDYIFRGLSYTEEKPAAQTYTEVGYGIFYGAIWASRADYLGVYGSWEFDVFLGARPVTGPITWDLGVWYYMFGSKDTTLHSSDLDYTEFKLGASINPVKNLTLSITGYYTPEQDVAVVETETVESAASFVLPQFGIFIPTVSGVLGWSGSDTNGYWLGEEDYGYWNAGLRLGVEKFFMDFRYWDTTIEHDSADARFVFTAGVTLP